jgi:molybdopterin synthase catalytic subunit
VKVQISENTFDPWQEVRSYQDANEHLAGNYGATSVFIGTMRDFNEGSDVQWMTLEYYPGMTETELEKIITEAKGLWLVLDVLIIHRVGSISPAQPIVLVAVWSVHRGDAFDACRFIMEALKSRAPFWKKEYNLDGHGRWVSENSDGYKR